MKSIHTIPKAAPADIVEFSRNCGVKVDGHAFNPDRIPQLLEPLRAMADPEVRIGTLVKPVQTGGSTVGEVVLAFWLSFYYGLVQMNWQDDLRAEERWHTRILDMLRSVKSLAWAGGRYDEKIGHAKFINSTLIVQGIRASGALDSETVPFQINEELHLWPRGDLSKARRRQTLVWLSKALDISNAGVVGDQLESAYEAGSMEVWESFCPGCGNPNFEANKSYHAMHFRWDEKRPELGGLRFDPDAGRLPNGKYNMNKVVPTIRYQMPCGFIVRDTPTERRVVAAGRYRKTNEGALASRRSWNYEAVSVAEIKLPDVVEQWFDAIRDTKYGITIRRSDGSEITPLQRFVQEVECRFWSPERHVPFSGETIYNPGLKKNRAGMKDRLYRGAKFDWQKGYKAKGELQHYWGEIWDVDIDANSQLVWEGMVESEAELLAEIDAHEVPHCNVWIDCTGVHNKTILQFCYQNGFNAVDLALSRKTLFLHPDGTRKFFSPGRPIHKELGVPPVFDPIVKRNPKTGERSELPNPEEPIVVSLNKAGLLANYFLIRNMKAAVLLANPKATAADYISLDIPADVSEDFKQQIESWEVVPGHRGSTKDESVDGFRPRSRNDHLLMCAAYHCFELEWKLHPNYELSLLGARLTALGIPQPENKPTTNDEK